MSHFLNSVSQKDAGGVVTVYNLIRLLLKEQSDSGLRCLLSLSVPIGSAFYSKLQVNRTLGCCRNIIRIPHDIASIKTLNS